MCLGIRLLLELDRPLVMMVYSDRENPDKDVTFYLQERHQEEAEERWARGNVRKNERVTELEKLRTEIIATVKEFKPRHPGQ